MASSKVSIHKASSVCLKMYIKYTTLKISLRVSNRCRIDAGCLHSHALHFILDTDAIEEGYKLSPLKSMYKIHVASSCTLLVKQSAIPDNIISGTTHERSLCAPKHAAISSTCPAGLLRCSYCSSSSRDFYWLRCKLPFSVFSSAFFQSLFFSAFSLNLTSRIPSNTSRLISAQIQLDT